MRGTGRIYLRKNRQFGEVCGSLKSMKIRVAFFILVLFSFTGCSFVPPSHYNEGVHAPGARTLVIWLLSDIQPKDVEGRKVFEIAVDDVNNNVLNVDLAIIAGDLLRSRSQKDAFEWFVAAREKSYIDRWYEIAGNHDVRSGEIFGNYFTKPTYYSVWVGNIVLLMMSDQSTDSRTSISADAFDWWDESVARNQDSIIITVTHAQLRESGLFGSFVESRRIENSSRFEDVLKVNRVALWASGHSHLPQRMAGTVNIEPQLGGTCFVNVSAIRDDSFMDSESRFLIFEENSDIAWLRSRNHSKQRFNPNLNIALKLNRPFRWDGTLPKLKVPH